VIPKILSKCPIFNISIWLVINIFFVWI